MTEQRRKGKQGDAMVDIGETTKFMLVSRDKRREKRQLRSEAIDRKRDRQNEEVDNETK